MFFGLPRGDLGGILEALGGVLEGLRGVLEGLGGVLEAKMSQDSAKMRQEPPQERNPRELPSGLRPQGRWRCAPTPCCPAGSAVAVGPGLILLLEGSSKKKVLSPYLEHALDSPRWSGGSKKASPIPPTP